jgi:hypothetical protein
MKIYKYIISLLFIIISNNIIAKTEDFQVWNTINVNINNINKSPFSLAYEFSPRYFDDNKNTFINRLALNYSINNKHSIGIGYGLTTINDDDIWSNFHGIFQQYIYKNNLNDNLTLANRFRVEQNFRNNDHGDVSVRLRDRLRFEYFISHLTDGLFFVLQDEFFINTITTNIVRSGIDQNRAFIGIGYKFNSTIMVETGYQNQWVNIRNNKEDKDNHVLLTTFNVNF